MGSGHQAVGHPVDVASGAVYLLARDATVPGRAAVTWVRRYHTALLAEPPGPFGPGWTTAYFASLTPVDGGYSFRTPEGAAERFADPGGEVPRGGVVRNLGTFQELARRAGRYVVTRWDAESGAVQRYAFAEGPAGRPWPLRAVEDETGVGVDLEYDPAGRLAAVRQRLGGRKLTVEYAGGRVAGLALVAPGDDPLPLARYWYDDRGRLAEVADPGGPAEAYEYDPGGRLTVHRARDGGVFFFKYDARGRCVRTWGRDGYDEKRLKFLDPALATLVTDSTDQTTTYQYLPSGQVTAVTDPLGAVTRYEYDEYGRPTGRANPNGAATAYEYDAQGNRRVTTDPLGGAFVVLHNADHRPVAAVDPGGGGWQWEYDDRGRWTALVNPVGARWAYGYDPAGNLTDVRGPSGDRSRFEYAPDGQVAGFTDPLGRTTRFGYDRRGRLTRRTEPTGEVTGVQYDPFDRPAEVTAADGSRVRLGYDRAGNLTRLVDGNGAVTAFRYGPCGRLLERTDPTGGRVRYTWGSEPDRLETVVNEAGEVYRFEYDPCGRVVREVGFDGAAVAYEYDPAGFCKAWVNGAGERLEYARDPAGRVVEKRLPDGTAYTYRYDPFGDVVHAAGPGGEVALERDVLGRVVREDQCGVEVEREFDPSGHLTGVRTGWGAEMAVTRDPVGRPSGVTAGPHRWEFERDAQGREVRRRLPGGLTLELGYDRAGQLASQQVAGFRRAFEYDSAGQVVRTEDTVRGAVRYRYDPAERLLEVDGRAREWYTYDPAGNLTKISVAPADGSAPAARELEYAAGNVLRRADDTRYEFDGDGRLTGKVGVDDGGEPDRWAFGWSADGQLDWAADPAGRKWQYQYDPFGRRVRKVGPDGPRQYLWLGDVVVQERGAGGPDTTWVWLPGTFRLVGRVQTGAAESVIDDDAGNSRELIDGAGRVTWAADTTAWGEPTGPQPGAGTPPVFCNQWPDPETGFRYTRYRYYDPAAGRFISRDPLGMTAGPNEYPYAPNPINWTDPLGLIIVYRNIRPDENPANGLDARRPGRGMTPSGHIAHGSRKNFKGSQFISTTTDPAVAAAKREPGQVTVRFDTDHVVADKAGNLSITDVSTKDKADARLRGRTARNFAAASKEVLVEGHVPPGAIEVVDPAEEAAKAGCSGGK